MREVRERLATAHELLERAQQTPEGERLWLLALVWSQLHEAAEVLDSRLRDEADGDHPTHTNPHQLDPNRD
jgi:hypothetical protein